MMNVCVKANKSPSPQMVEEEEEEAVHFGKILFERLHNQPDDHIAYENVHTERSITFKELKIRSKQLATFMHGKNVKKGQSVLFLGENCIRFPEVYAACAYLGAVFQPINPNLETTLLGRIATIGYLRMIFFHGPYTELVDQIKKNEAVDATTFDLDNKLYKSIFNTVKIEEAIKFQPHEYEQTDRALLINTAGHTGDPKTIELNHYQLFFSTQETINYLALYRPKVITNLILPHYHIVGLQIMLGTMLFGYKLVVLEDTRPELFEPMIIKYEITSLMLIPWILHRFVHLTTREDFTHKSVDDVIILGGYMVKEDIVEMDFRFKDCFFRTPFYTTELMGVVSIEPRHNHPVYLDNSPKHEPHLVSYKYRDHDYQLGPKSVLKEILVKRPTLMARQYLKKGAPPVPVKTDFESFIEAGDFGKPLLSNRHCKVVFRSHDVFYHNGWLVIRKYLENLLMAHEEVIDCVTARRELVKGQKNYDAIMFAVVKENKDNLEEELYDHMKTAVLISTQVPGNILIWDRIPRDKYHNIDRDLMDQIAANLTDVVIKTKH